MISTTPSQVQKSAVLSIDVIFFVQITIKIISVAFSESRQLQTLLLAWRERESHWHDGDRIIAVQPMVICFSWEKQLSVAPQNVYSVSIFFFPHYYPLALAVNKSPAVYILSPALEGLWKENRGSVNRLRLTSKCRVRKYDHWIYHSVEGFCLFRNGNDNSITCCD